MRKCFLIAVCFLAAIVGPKVQASDMDFEVVNNTVSFYEIEQQWHKYNFFTATRNENPKIQELFLSFAHAYPNELFHFAEAHMLGLTTEGFMYNYVLDTQNGFFQCEGMTELTWKIQMCYWRCNDGGILVGVALIGDEYKGDLNINEGDPEEPTINVNGLMFYKIDKGEVMWWPKTPKQMCGQDFNFHLYDIELPRQGKDIKLNNDTGKSYVLKWNGNGFTVK